MSMGNVRWHTEHQGQPVCRMIRASATRLHVAVSAANGQVSCNIDLRVRDLTHEDWIELTHLHGDVNCHEAFPPELEKLRVMLWVI